jgi:hypothetical protein
MTAPVARTVPRRPEPEPPAEDVYGLDEAPTAVPLPPTMPRSAGAEPAEPPAKKKRKKSGFFSSGNKKSSGGSFQYSGVGVGPLRLIAILVCVGAGVVGGWRLLPKSDIEGMVRTLIQQANDTAASLETIRDVPSAQAAAPRVRAGFESIIATLEKSKGKKGRKTDIDEINRRYAGQVPAAFQRLGAAVGRASQIPGVSGILGIDPLMARMMTLLQEIEREG